MRLHRVTARRAGTAAGAASLHPNRGSFRGNRLRPSQQAGRQRWPSRIARAELPRSGDYCNAMIFACLLAAGGLIAVLCLGLGVGWSVPSAAPEPAAENGSWQVRELGFLKA